MLVLIRNLTDLTQSASEYDSLPSSTDCTSMADMARIKHYRNHLAHCDGKIESAFFITAWEDISGAIGRLGGPDMDKECKELRTKHLDQTTVPLDVKVKFNQIMDQWRKNDTNFIETRAAKHVLKCVQKNSCVTITASFGVGKTATLRHVVLKMAEEGYDILMVNNPHDIVKFYNPNQKTLFVIDDFCGTYSINQSDVNNWKSVIKRIQELIKNTVTKIIVACRLQVYKDQKFESLFIFRTLVCNLLSDDLCLSQPEKKSIAELYLETEATKMIQYCDTYDCFPLLCNLCHNNPDLKNTDFLKNLFSVYEAEIEQLIDKRHSSKYCALALCVIFNNRVPEKVLTEEINLKWRTAIENTCKECKLNKGTPRLILLDELNSLEHTFIKKEQGVYATIHDKLFDFLSYHFGKNMIQCLIKNAHSSFIIQRFLLEKEDDMDQFITIVPSKYHQMYIQRMIDDWFDGQVFSVFKYINMASSEFRQTFFKYLTALSITFQRQLALTYDVNQRGTALVYCCYREYIPFIQWCLYHHVDVNLCTDNGLSPVFVSSETGQTEMLKMLLKNKAETNQCLKGGTSPLYVACQNGHKDIVKLLLHNKADINKCTDDGASALHKACEKGDIGIVKLLLNNNANVNACTASGVSPLFAACNYVDIVKLLLHNKADMYKCIDNGASPLFIACEKGLNDTVKLLLENKAETNQCAEGETSPLYIACQNGHKYIVKLLLDNKADINKCTADEISPLFIACQKNYVDIVTILLDNKADINNPSIGDYPLLLACRLGYIDIVQLLLKNKADTNNFTDDGASALHVACGKGDIGIVKLLLNNNANVNACTTRGISPLFVACNYVDIVKLLLHNKADINKCIDNGASPLFIACENGLNDTVKLLLENKADVNQCAHSELSPLYIACQNGMKDVAKMLLDYKADINKCIYDGTSPLSIACRHGYTDIVKMLLDKKADINKCTADEISPLFIACQKNYVDIVTILLDNKADINNPSKGDYPLLLACRLRYIDIVQLLLKNKADTNKCTDDGVSALHVSCVKGDIGIVKLLLNNKANVNACTSRGISPLLVACQDGLKDLVKLLLENKADVNKCHDTGASPLYIACQNGMIDVAKLLLDYKADINKCTYDGKSPLSIACRQGCTDIVKMLLDKNADINKCDNDGVSPLKFACHEYHINIVKLLLDNKQTLISLPNKD